jgi:arylsulfatase A-like enzyme
VPAMVRCPGTVPAGVVTEEMLSAHDWYKTFAAFAGALDRVPTDRPLDGVDASKFLTGDSEHTGRESIVFFGPDGSMMSVKAHNIKFWLRYSEGFDKPILKPQVPLVFDLGSDPSERHNLILDKMDMTWEFGVVMGPAADYLKSFAEYPNIKPGEEFNGYPVSPSPAAAPQSVPED